MRNLYRFGQSLLAVLQDFVSRDGVPAETRQEALAPIRCGSDPTKIYLA